MSGQDASRQAQNATEDELREKQELTRRYENQGLYNLREAIERRNLAICVGSGVTLSATASEDSNGILQRLTWKGLIRNGFHYLEYLDRHISEEDRDIEFDIAKAILNSNKAKAENLLTAATTLTRLLKKIPGRYASWLEFQFKDLSNKVTDQRIFDSLKKLHDNSVLLITTNYDDLIEKKCGLHPCDQTTPNEVKDFLVNKHRERVFHPHGYWEHPESVVLDLVNYYKVQSDDEIQSQLRNILSSKIVLFIGCGGGLADPNFGKLLEWIRDRNKEIGHRHYILLRKGDDNPVPELGLQEVVCDGFDDIGPWLGRLVEDEVQTGAVHSLQTEGTINDIPETAERRRMHWWLQPLDQSKFLADISSICGPDSNDLLLENDKRIVDWERGSSSLVWLHGEDGWGKTVLCSSIINNTRKRCRLSDLGRSRDSLAYFFCSTFDIYKQDPPLELHDFSTFARTVIDHLCPLNHVSTALRELYYECTRHHPATKPTQIQLHRVLLLIFEQLCTSEKPTPRQGKQISRGVVLAATQGETYLIIDGLDKIQCNKRESYLIFIKKLIERKLPHLHILLTSQDERSIRAALENCGEWIMILLDRETMRTAIYLFVANSLEADSQLGALSDHLKEVIVKRLVSEEGESFRWVSKMIVALKQLDDVNDAEIDKLLPSKSIVPERTEPRSESASERNYPSESWGTGPPELLFDKKRRTTFQFESAVDDTPNPMNLRASKRWLQEYFYFLDEWIDPVWTRLENPSMRIKIAILDVGFDSTDPYIRGSQERIRDSRCFVEGEQSMEDLDGRGTHAISLLLKLAPTADLFAARIAKNKQITPSQDVQRAVAQAIFHAAMLWRVDIIILPFSFNVAVQEVAEAIREAFMKKIQIFSATGNSVAQRMAFPASMREVIAVSATNARGTPSAFNPPSGGVDENFATLGEDVQSSWPRALGAKTKKQLSGTSVATVIAAALGATVLSYVRQSFADLGVVSEANSSYGMRALLKALAVRDGGLAYVCPWNLFLGNKNDTEANRVNEVLKKALLYNL